MSQEKKFKFSQRSLLNMKGVHPDLVKVLNRAIEITELDFTVTEGLRTKATQLENYRTGKSKTKDKSRHLIGSDGYGHAVDLMAVGVSSVWDFEHYYVLAKAIQKASQEYNIPIRWGGAWHFRLNEETRSPIELTERYKRTQRETGKNIFLDGVHFELPLTDAYPQ